MSADYLKSESDFDLNISDKNLDFAILVSQNIEIQNILGTTLYKKLLEEVSNDPTLSGITTEIIDLKLLLDDYVRPTLLYLSIIKAIVPVQIRIKNRGILKNSATNAESVDIETLSYIKGVYEPIAEKYSNNTKKYLCDFFIKYPLLKICDGGSDSNTPNKDDEFFCGIIL